MRVLLVLAAVAAMAAGPVMAAEAPKTVASDTAVKQELVRRYFRVLDFEKLMDGMIATMIPVMTEQTARRNPQLTPEQRDLINDVVREAMREVMTPRIIEASVELYAEAFTEPELRALVSFYESPEGRSIIQKMPAMMPKAAALTRDLMPEMEKEVTARVCARIDCTAQTRKRRPS